MALRCGQHTAWYPLAAFPCMEAAGMPETCARLGDSVCVPGVDPSLPALGQ